jgi:hypothetical protein
MPGLDQDVGEAEEVLEEGRAGAFCVEAHAEADAFGWDGVVESVS